MKISDLLGYRTQNPECTRTEPFFVRESRRNVPLVRITLLRLSGLYPDCYSTERVQCAVRSGCVRLSEAQILRARGPVPGASVSW